MAIVKYIIDERVFSLVCTSVPDDNYADVFKLESKQDKVRVVGTFPCSMFKPDHCLMYFFYSEQMPSARAYFYNHDWNSWCI